MSAAGEAVYRYEGRDLRVAEIEGYWRVVLDERTAEARFLDQALAELLQLDTASAVALARRILEAPEGGAVGA